MRRISFVLGLVGGVVGLAVHAVLLALFFSHTTGLFEVFVQLALAAALGLAAVLIAVLCRGSLSTLAVLLMVVGVLGFFPRPLSWAPAGLLLIAGGAVALASLLQAGRRPTRPAAPVSPAGLGLHWSEAARLGIPASPRPTVHQPRDAQAWSGAHKTRVVAGALLGAAIVIPLSLWSPNVGVTGSDPAVAIHTTTTAHSPRNTTSTSQSSSTERSTTTTAGAGTSTTATAGTGLDSFADAKRGIGISYPSDWRNTDPGEVGLRIYGGRNQALERAYDKAYVAAAFADWQGPTYDGCYLDYFSVEVYDDEPTNVSQLSQIQADEEKYIDWLRANLSGVKLLEPFREITIGTATGFDYTWCLSYGGQKLNVMDCTLVANNTQYFLEFTAVDKDWKKCHSLFEQLLQTFTVRGSEPLA